MLFPANFFLVLIAGLAIGGSLVSSYGTCFSWRSGFAGFGALVTVIVRRRREDPDGLDLPMALAERGGTCEHSDRVSALLRPW